MPLCIFCKIARGEAAAEILYQDNEITAFQDIHPITPVHLLVIPNVHLDSLNGISEENEPLLGHMIVVARKLAAQAGLDHSGYRLVINTGPDAGQSVSHLHLHLIGGRHMPFRFE